MKKLLLQLLLISVSTISAQVGIGTTTPAGALDITSTTNGILIPRVALSSKIAAAPVVNPVGGGTPVNGTLVFNTATAGVNPNNVVPGFYFWNSIDTKWIRVLDDVTPLSGWSTTGNPSTSPGTNFVGTTDPQDLVFRTNNVQTARIDKSGASFSVGLNAGNGGSIDNTNFIGRFAGNQAPNAHYSNFIGSGAGNGASNALYSNFIGAGAGNGATQASKSNFIGYFAGYQASSAYNSNFQGERAGQEATNANNSNFFGNQAGSGATNANNSNFFGPNAGYNAIGAANSNFIGNIAGSSAIAATNSNFFGTAAGQGASDAYNANFIGNNAGIDAINASNSNFFGYEAGFQATAASNSNFLGLGSGKQATNANNANFLGSEAGYNAASANNSNFFGQSAGFIASNANDSNFLGRLAGGAASGANNSNFFGLSAGEGAVNARKSNFFGFSAGGEAENANNSHFFGENAGYLAANARYSIFIGTEAGREATNSNNSIFIGNNAGTSNGNDNSTGGTSILIGDDTTTGGFSNSIAIGKSAANTKQNQFTIAPAYTELSLGGIEYTVPAAQGTASQVLRNDGTGVLSWTSSVSNAINGLTTALSTTKLGGNLVNNTTITQAGFDFNLLGGKFEQRFTMPVDGSISGITNSANGLAGYPEESLSLFNVDTYPFTGVAGERMSRVFVSKGNAGIGVNGTSGTGGVIYAEESGGAYLRSFFSANNVFDVGSNTSGLGFVDSRTAVGKAKATFDANSDEILFETGNANQSNFSISKANGLLFTKNGPTRFSVNTLGDMFLGRSLTLSGSGSGTSGQVLTSGGANTVLTWTTPLSAASVWGKTGNASTNPATDYIGTTDAVDFVTRTTGTERMRVLAGGNVGIGTPTPNSNLQVNGSVSTNIRILSTGTVAANDYTVLVTGSISLPNANTALGRMYYLINNTAGSHTLTASPNFKENGVTVPTYNIDSMAGTKGILVQSDGTDWIILSKF